MSDRRWTLAAVVLALLWGVGPALPPLLRGELLGHGLTDLYPSVWGLWHFTALGGVLPDETHLLAHPGGMGFYYSSPIKGWLATPLLPLLGLKHTFNLLTLLARVGTVLAAYGAGRAWGLRGPGALAAAAVYGCAPFFQGYEVEGIVEGTDGWTLALWAWAVGAKRWALAPVTLALTILSSWYLGMAGCLLVVVAALRHRLALVSLGGLALAAPALLRFGGAFPETAPLDDAIRVAMGASPGLWTPGLAPGLNPFAITAFVGVGTLGLAAWSRSPLALLALLPAALSTGWGPWYDLPVLELVRFPYRWHAATLAILALAAGRGVDRLPRLAGLAAPLLVLEGLLLSPIEPVLPGAEADHPPILAAVEGPVLDVPGPVALPPGQPNPSRRRARYLLYDQAAHGQPIAWRPDFNSVGVAAPGAAPSDPFVAWDRMVSKGNPPPLGEGAVAGLADAGIRTIVLHKSELGSQRLRALHDQLVAQGAVPVTDDGKRWLLSVPPR
jgi:hypothetical protein